MKILYSTYPTAFNFFGGGEIQLLRTKEGIEKIRKNYCVKLFDIFHDNLELYDILHNFSMNQDCLSLCKMAKTKNVKVAISPIYWTDSEFRNATKTNFGFKQNFRGNIEDLLVKTERFFKNLIIYKFPTFQQVYPYKEFLELSDIILPNSKIEASLISRRFRIRREKFHVVPNGVDSKFLDAKPDLFIEKYGLEDPILFVGRLERRKNVLALLKAYQGIEAPLVMIGHPSVWEYDYFESIKKVVNSNPNIHYLGFFPPNSKELLSAYAAAKVYVLPSWYETPGIAALEAGLAGCNVVITNRGSTTEYFRDLAWYVDPTSTEDIREKILDALEKPRTSTLQKLILRNYTWEKVAEKTLEAYDIVLSAKRAQ